MQAVGAKSALDPSVLLGCEGNWLKRSRLLVDTGARSSHPSSATPRSPPAVGVYLHLPASSPKPAAVRGPAPRYALRRIQRWACSE